MMVEIDNNNRLKIVVIGAHPDDFEIGLGMRLMDHVKKGDYVVGIICSDGEKSGKRKIRLKEAECAAKYIGIKKLYKLHFPDTNFPSLTTVKDRLEKIINKEKPSMVYTHFKEDLHQDHRIVSEASAIACRRVPNILNYKSLSTFHNSFYPHFFHIGSEEDFQKKKELLEIYKSQIERNGIVDLNKMKIDLKFYASFIPSFKDSYAEPFCANHVVLNLFRIHND